MQNLLHHYNGFSHTSTTYCPESPGLGGQEHHIDIKWALMATCTPSMSFDNMPHDQYTKHEINVPHKHKPRWQSETNSQPNTHKQHGKRIFVHLQAQFLFQLTNNIPVRKRCLPTVDYTRNQGAIKWIGLETKEEFNELDIIPLCGVYTTNLSSMRMLISTKTCYLRCTNTTIRQIHGDRVQCHVFSGTPFTGRH